VRNTETEPVSALHSTQSRHLLTFLPRPAARPTGAGWTGAGRWADHCVLPQATDLGFPMHSRPGGVIFMDCCHVAKLRCHEGCITLMTLSSCQSVALYRC